MPTPSTLWSDIFGDARPVEIEIGPGLGDVLMAFAAAAPERGFFGIERSYGLADAIMARATTAGLTNVRAVGGDAREIVAHYVPPGSVHAYHVYFPDPWPKRRHHRRKLFHPEFVAALLRTLEPGGLLYLATDLSPLLDEMHRALSPSPFTRADDVPPRARPTTHFERRYGRAGTFASVWRSPRG